MEAKEKKRIRDMEYSKQWRRDNPKKVKAYQLMRYQRDRVRILKDTKVWVKDNRQKVNKYKREWRARNKEYQAMLDKTKSFFKHIKVQCELCGSKKNLLFHHLKPLAYDNFQVLCDQCHYKVHAEIRKSSYFHGGKS